MQDHAGHFLSLAPSMGSKLQVAFYARPAEQIAEQHPLVACLLQIAKPRSGCYLCQVQQLANLAGIAPSEASSILICWSGMPGSSNRPARCS